MTIIDTTLYANGALRLSRHGAGKGGNVLVHVPTGRQVELTDSGADKVPQIIENMLNHPPRNQWSSEAIFDNIRVYWSVPKSAAPGWYHN